MQERGPYGGIEGGIEKGIFIRTGPKGTYLKRSNVELYEIVDGVVPQIPDAVPTEFPTMGSADFSERIGELLKANRAQALGQLPANDPLASLTKGGQYVELQFHTRPKVEDIESIDIIRRPHSFYDSARNSATDFPESINGFLQSYINQDGTMNTEALADEMLALAEQDKALAAQLRSQLDEMGLGHVRIRTGAEFILGLSTDYSGSSSGAMGEITKETKEIIPRSQSVGSRVIFDTEEGLAEEQIGMIQRIRAATTYTEVEDILKETSQIKKAGQGMGAVIPKIEPPAKISAQIASNAPSEAIAEVRQTQKAVAEAVSASTESVSFAKRTLSKILEGSDLAARVMRFKA